MIWVFAVGLIIGFIMMFLDFANQGEDTVALIIRDLFIIGLVIFILTLLV